MYVLAYVKNAEPPTEGFNISNSEIADVNGDYFEVKIAGIDPEDYTAIYEYLVNHNELEDDNQIKDDISSPFYTNGKCYITYCGMTTYILPKVGSSIHFYYKSFGGMIPISDMDPVENPDTWVWKDDPFTGDWGSGDWTNRNILHVISYDGKTY